jgi:hypothetical protein
MIFSDKNEKLVQFLDRKLEVWSFPNFALYMQVRPGAYPTWELHTLTLTLKFLDRLEILASGKCSSSFVYTLSDERTKFGNIDTWSQFYKTFFWNL